MRRIHCAYHKCLTIYFSRVMSRLYNDLRPKSGGYKHFNSHLDEFYESLGKFRILSVNNHKPDFDRLGDFRVTRFVRDPRDLVVSGYLYHKRGAEKWSNVVDPTPDDWKVVNGNIPAGMKAGESYATHLQALPEEDGLLTEIEFRKRHFEGMLAWPEHDPRVLAFRYEDILGNEVATFARIFEFYRLPLLDRAIGRWLASRYSAKKQRRRMEHIRNPEPAQWKKRFTPRVTERFMDRYGELVERFGYER